jgi:FtsP/CotA-like multicopper oxidase with cupredoxin domain
MYHSHHNATDQVGRGLLGAFIVQPRDPALRYDKLYGATQDIVWISNDTLGGFTINGRGFPATAPIVARLGETIVIRFMNEGTMMHPWHLHGMRCGSWRGTDTRSGRRRSPATPWASTPASAGTSS